MKIKSEIEMDLNKFYKGQMFDAYKWLGAHVREKGVMFRTYAPHAKRVDLLWENQEIPLLPAYDGSFYEAMVPGAKAGDKYEFRVYGRDGNVVDHCDPYGFGMELRPAHKSIVRNLNWYKFHDEEWMKNRTDMLEKPLNIYELHLGSWRKKTQEQMGWYRYDEMAEPLVKYLKMSGYNYAEFMPISEHPSDESWGYQSTGFYAPTSRYGTMNQLKKLIDILHQNQIGVILDFVPVHFAADSYGLAHFDGMAVYEYPHSDVGVSEWGSNNFMHAHGEIRSFLQSSANYWLKEYHFDGLRMDAISRLIYWQGDERRGENGNAIDFLKVMNRGLKRLNPGCILAAEDSTNYPNVTRDVDRGGLGFDYKWDMGWMHDTLEYFQSNPEERIGKYHKLTFSMMYFQNENYILPFSHDEVVHGKATILQKMNGQYEQKFPQAKAMYLYMMIHPGKKLNFMGNEIGQLREWDEKREQDWDLRKYPKHDSFYCFIAKLNDIYLSHPSLWRWDYRPEGFQWLDCNQESLCIYSILRTAGKERLAAIFNFSSHVQKKYQVKINGANKCSILLYSDWKKYGGATPEEEKVAVLNEEILICNLNPFSAILMRIE